MWKTLRRKGEKAFRSAAENGGRPLPFAAQLFAQPKRTAPGRRKHPH